MIKSTTFMFSEESIQKLIINQKVVKVLHNHSKEVTLVITGQVRGFYSEHSDLIFGKIDGQNLPGFYCYQIFTEDINRIEVLDNTEALIWKLENNF